MGSLSIWHWMVVLLIAMMLFGGNKVSTLMGDFAKGIKAFKKNMAEDDVSMEASERAANAIKPPEPNTQAPSRETTTAGRN
jgi:sec-independent protein translocase protein TatA